MSCTSNARDHRFENNGGWGPLSLRHPWRAVLFSVLIVVLCAHVHAAEIEMGREGETVRQVVETLTASSTVGARWQPAGPAASPAAVVPVPRALDTSPWPAAAGGGSHLGNAAAAAGPVPATGASTIPRVISGGPPKRVQVSGLGTADVTAMSDGPVTIEVLLTTYQPATIEIRLLNPDGTEVMVNGHSLLEWVRPDDTANAPVWFQGRKDPDSMETTNGRDYSPKRGLQYTFNIKQGQRLVISTTGNALPASYARATSSAF